jgi:hypothetical protein
MSNYFILFSNHQYFYLDFYCLSKICYYFFLLNTCIKTDKKCWSTYVILVDVILEETKKYIFCYTIVTFLLTWERKLIIFYQFKKSSESVAMTVSLISIKLFCYFVNLFLFLLLMLLFGIAFFKMSNIFIHTFLKQLLEEKNVLKKNTCFSSQFEEEIKFYNFLKLEMYENI